MKVLLRDERMRPVLQTPAKGSVGDRCIESEVGETDIPTILRKYAGNLQELMAWRGNLKFGVQPPDNFEDSLRAIERVKEIYDQSGTDLSFRDWVDNVLQSKEITNPEPAQEVKNDETNENQEVHE